MDQELGKEVPSRTTLGSDITITISHKCRQLNETDPDHAETGEDEYNALIAASELPSHLPTLPSQSSNAALLNPIKTCATVVLHFPY